MKERTNYISVPDGFVIKEDMIETDIDSARRMLLSRKKRSIVSAIRAGDMAYLTKQTVKCPHCGHELPVLSASAVGTSGMAYYQKQDVDNWATQQLSLFGKPNPNLRHSDEPIQLNEEIRCPRCKQKSSKSANSTRVLIKETFNTLLVSCEMVDVTELFSLSWIISKTMRIAFPIYETLGINIGKGRVFIRLESLDGRVITERDLTGYVNAWKDGNLLELIDKSALVRREIKKFFVRRWKGPLPFAGFELTPRHIVQMAQYSGYHSRTFYAGIPYLNGMDAMDISFGTICKKLHRAENVPCIYRASSLPQVKSIRKIIFNHPELLFYLQECESLAEILNNVNHFAKIISGIQTFIILSLLHTYPTALEFCRDCVEYKGSCTLIRLLEHEPESVMRYAIEYASLNISLRAEERKMWKKGKMRSLIYRPTFDNEESTPTDLFRPTAASRYSIPMGTVNESMRDCIIDGYSFSWLRSSNDYIAAGRQLHNCLRSWSIFDYPVVAVRAKGMVVAAAEIRNDKVWQIRAEGNTHIWRDVALYTAYQKWLKRYHLVKMRFDCDEDDDIPL